MQKSLYFILLVSFLLYSCSISRHVQQYAEADLIHAGELQHAHIGICVYDPLHHKYIYEHEGKKYFTPASNTKLYTLFTGLSILGDSTTGIFCKENSDTLYIQGTGDPSIFHPDFPHQPVVNFLKNTPAKVIVFTNPADENKIFGPGWAWDDYSEDYQPERSAMPLYGNVIWYQINSDNITMQPDYFLHSGKVIADTLLKTIIHRELSQNIFYYHPSDTTISGQVPFKVFNGLTTVELLEDTLHKKIIFDPSPQTWQDGFEIKNVPIDSLFKHMMYRSDNFYAEQTQQMCSAKMFDTISTSKMIDYMLSHQLQDLPQRPSWVDGSGLSRYNLFTPEDMITVLMKLYDDFSPQVIYAILPSGSEGTLSHLYKRITGDIYAKTGSLNNNVALSGYLITHKKRTLFFSILIANYRESGKTVREAMENFLLAIHDRY